MLLVRVFSTEHWLPARGATSNGQHACLKMLITALPELVAETLQEVEGQKVNAKDVTVIPLLLHPWRVNCSDIRVELESNKAAASGARTAIVRKLMDRITDFVEESVRPPYRPEITLSCKPQPSSGMTTDPEGRTIDSWSS